MDFICPRWVCPLLLYILTNRLFGSIVAWHCQTHNSLSEWICFAHGSVIDNVVHRTKAVLAHCCHGSLVRQAWLEWLLEGHQYLCWLCHQLYNQSASLLLWLVVCLSTCVQREFFLRLLALPAKLNTNETN